MATFLSFLNFISPIWKQNSFGVEGYLRSGSRNFLVQRNRRFTANFRRNMKKSIAVPPKTVIILAGATSVGKSAVSLELCKHFPSEIIIADSVQVYKGLNIGSNKPTPEEQSVVPHHLIDITTPQQQLSSADFCYLAVDAINDIHKRGKTPVLVGGSTMWIQWLVHGIPDAPKGSEEAMQLVETLIGDYDRNNDWDSAIAVLQEYDPSRAGRMMKNDWYRLRRYLAVAIDLSKKNTNSEGTEKLSTEDNNASDNEEKKGNEKSLLTAERTPLLPASEYDVRCFFLAEDREELYTIIDERCEQMIFAGLLKETAQLILNNTLTPAELVTKAIGYRQAINYFTSERPEDGFLSTSVNYDLFYLEFLRDFSTATRNYAKDQLKWYRKDASFLFTRIYRNLRDKKSFQLSYEDKCEELLSLITLPREEYLELLDHQVKKNKYVMKYILPNNTRSPKVKSGYRCENEMEYDVIMELLNDKQMTFVKGSGDISQRELIEKEKEKDKCEQKETAVSSENEENRGKQRIINEDTVQDYFSRKQDSSSSRTPLQNNNIVHDNRYSVTG
jgi:tRNA dimethylallyltransferase